MSRTALLLGATGLVGRHTLAALVRAATWDRVVTLARRPLAEASRHHESRVVDFDALGEMHLECDDLFCALGTTMKQAGSREAFRRVDYDYVVEAALRAVEGGARQVLLVSAYGADSTSRVFYNRVKGEAEEAVRALGVEALQLFRPSLLSGDRDESRPGEQIGEAALRVVRPFLVGPLRALRPTPAQSVARALVRVGAERPAGVHAYGPNEIRDLGA